VTWFVAGTALLVAGGYALWPLIRHQEPFSADTRPVGSGASRRLALEELELDLAAGRIDEKLAAELRATWDR
jgi:hypothetical protein